MILAAETSLSSLAVPYGSQKINFAELEPVDIRKIQLGIGCLPDHEVAETLSARPYHKVRLLAKSQMGFYDLFIDLLATQASTFHIPEKIPKRFRHLALAAVAQRYYHFELTSRARLLHTRRRMQADLSRSMIEK